MALLCSSRKDRVKHRTFPIDELSYRRVGTPVTFSLSDKAELRPSVRSVAVKLSVPRAEYAQVKPLDAIVELLSGVSRIDVRDFLRTSHAAQPFVPTSWGWRR